MDVDLEELLQPLGAGAPCGPDARELDAFTALRAMVDQVDRSGEAPRVDWARQQERILELARQARDLRVWVWLAQSLLATDRLPGLAQGFEVLALGLARYWDTLPPFDDEDDNPRERFMARLAALSAIGGSNFQTKDSDLLTRRSTLLFLEEFEQAIAATRPDAEGQAVARRLEASFAALEALFKERYGAAGDPQLGFGLLRQRLGALQPRAEHGKGNGHAPVGRPTANGHGPVNSRDEVVAALDLVLDYYRRNEPSSPVPLLVGRAKRLVAMTFLDAIKELAPGGLKELQAVAGAGDEHKANR
jgi:type VI secretion system protein ImpA